MDLYQSAMSAPTEGAARDPEHITLAELLREFPPSPARPDWMVTRYPVPLEEFQRLKVEARQPEQRPQTPLAQAGVVIDAAHGISATSLEAPEGESLQASATAPAEAAPITGASFDGIPATAWQPPDNAIGVGPDDVMVAVNIDLAVYSKTGTLKFRWANMTSLFNPMLPSGATLFDPRVAFDHYAGRWIVVVGARRQTPAGSWLMVAVSQGPDPAGAYWIWALDATLDGSTPTQNWADYPMLGFDTQAIYICSNMFQFSGGYQYAKLRILNKAELYAGGQGSAHTIRWNDLWNLKNLDNSVAFTVQPAKHFRGTGGNPNAYLVNSLFPTGSALTLWTLANPLGSWTGGAAVLSRAGVNCQSYALPPHAQQPGSTTLVDTGDIRLLNAMYQNAGNAQRLWTAHTSKFTWSGDTEARAAVQWYEIDIPGQNIVQQGVFGAPGNYYSYPAIHTDASRNAFVVFTRSSSSIYAEMRQTGRKQADPPNTMQGSALVRAGAGPYNGGRWGDYFGICRDPGSSSEVWMYGEYANTGNTWATRVCSAKF